MYRTSKTAGFALSLAFLLSPSMVLADEVSSTSVKTDTPVGSASTSVKTRSNAYGNARSVEHTASTAGESRSTSIRAEAGANGAKIEREHTGIRANGDGSVTANKVKESHAVGINGSAHKASSSSTTVGADGSASTVKSERASTTP